MRSMFVVATALLLWSSGVFAQDVPVAPPPSDAAASPPADTAPPPAVAAPVPAPLPANPPMTGPQDSDIHRHG